MLRVLLVVALLVSVGCSDDNTDEPVSGPASRSSVPVAGEDRGGTTITTRATSEAEVAGLERPRIPIRAAAPTEGGFDKLSILGARSSDGHDALLVRLPGALGSEDSCGTVMSPVAVQEGSVLTLYSRRGTPSRRCDVAYSETTVWVPTPELAGRASIVDGATASSVPVFDGTSLVWPETLPAGWTMVSDRGQDGEWERAYSRGPGASQVRLVIHQGRDIDQLAPVHAWRTVRSVTVGGHPAALIAQGKTGNYQLGVRWEHEGHDVLVYLAAADPAAGPVNEALLLDLAGRFSPDAAESS